MCTGRHSSPLSPPTMATRGQTDRAWTRQRAHYIPSRLMRLEVHHFWPLTSHLISSNLAMIVNHHPPLLRVHDGQAGPPRGRSALSLTDFRHHATCASTTAIPPGYSHIRLGTTCGEPSRILATAVKSTWPHGDSNPSPSVSQAHTLPLS